MGLNFDDILNKYAGLFKNYQRRRVAAITILANFIFVNSSLASVFIAFEPDHHCKIPSEIQNVNCTHEQLKGYLFPLDANNNAATYDKCVMFSKNYSDITEIDICQGDNETQSEDSGTVKCQEWHYVADRSRTVVMEWDLVCDRKSLAKTTAGGYLAARVFGVFFSGWLADR